jgi:ABC-type Co2+ transport system permease subunit
MFVISMAINSVVSAFSIPMNITLNRMPTVAMMFAPARIVIGIAQGIVSAAIGSCLLACFVSMTEER